MNVREPKTAERQCRDCNRSESDGANFADLNGRPSLVCRSCSTRKRNATVAQQKADLNQPVTDDLIQQELWKNYNASKSTSERIRVLEALVKLRPADQKSQLDDAVVIQSLMQSLKKKKSTAG